MNPGRRAIGLALGATPNPFSISTELAYELPATGAIRVAVYDALGRAVAELARGAVPPDDMWSLGTGATRAGDGCRLGLISYASSTGPGSSHERCSSPVRTGTFGRPLLK